MAKTNLAGNPVQLAGEFPQKNQTVENLTAVKQDLSVLSLDDLSGKRKVLNIFPSIDTDVCATSVRTFNQKAAALENTVVICLSFDLPFAQKRWCAGADIDRVKVLSDYQEYSLAFSYGVLIKELKLLSRSAFVIDADDTIRYVQHVSELTDEPDYEAILAAAKGEIVTKQVPGDGFCGAY